MWLYGRYEQPGQDESVEDTGIGTTKVALNYDPEESAFDPGIASKSYCNPTIVTSPVPTQTNQDDPNTKYTSGSIGSDQEQKYNRIRTKKLNAEIYRKNATFKEGQGRQFLHNKHRRSVERRSPSG